jgi:hypothetical protein
MHLTDFAGGSESSVPEINLVDPSDPATLLSYNSENMLIPICLAAITMIFMLACIVGQAMDKFQQKEAWKFGLLSAGEHDHRKRSRAQAKHLTSIWARVRLLFFESLKKDHLFLNIYFVPGWHPMNRPIRLGLLLASILTMLTVEAMFFGKDNESSSQKLAVTIIACVVCLPPDLIFCLLIEKVSTFVGETKADVEDNAKRSAHKNVVTVDNPMILYRDDIEAEDAEALVAPSRRMLNNPLMKWDVDDLKQAWRDTTLQRAVDEGTGWKVLFDDATQKKYYWNYLTGQTVWNPWERVVEASTGEVHFHNFVTKEVAWQPSDFDIKNEDVANDDDHDDPTISVTSCTTRTLNEEIHPTGPSDGDSAQTAPQFERWDSIEGGVADDFDSSKSTVVVRQPIAPIHVLMQRAHALQRNREERIAALQWINEELPFVRLKIQAFGLQTCGKLAHEDIVLRVTHLNEDGVTIILHESTVACDAPSPQWPSVLLQIQDAAHAHEGVALGDHISLECWECDRQQQYVPVAKIGEAHTTIRWLMQHEGETLRIKSGLDDNSVTRGGVAIKSVTRTYVTRKDTAAFHDFVASEEGARYGSIEEAGVADFLKRLLSNRERAIQLRVIIVGIAVGYCLLGCFIVILCIAATQLENEGVSEILEYCSLLFMMGGLVLGFVGLLVPALIPVGGTMVAENEVNAHSAITIQRYFRGHLGRRLRLRRRVYIAWEKAGTIRKILKIIFSLLLVTYISFMLYILLLYGLMFTNETGADWFFSSTMGLLIGAMIQDPFVSFITCMFTAWRMRKFQPHVLTAKFALGLSKIQQERLQQQHKVGEKRASKNHRPLFERRNE